MKPRIQCVLTQSNPGFIAFGSATGRSGTPDPVRPAGLGAYRGSAYAQPPITGD